jgi:D-sedoheptulose 7-phosphate isomerase
VSDVEAFVAESVRASVALQQELEPLYPDIAAAAELLVESYAHGGKPLFFGNGGSAADAQHFACELVGRFNASRAPLAALALSVNASTVTAIANDYGYDTVFSRQLRAYSKPGDVAVAISTSGRSSNVVAAAKLKHALDLKLVALTGEDGEVLRPFADVVIAVPSSVTPRVQEAHVLIGHILCDWVERRMFPETVVSG